MSNPEPSRLLTPYRCIVLAMVLIAALLYFTDVPEFLYVFVLLPGWFIVMIGASLFFDDTGWSYIHWALSVPDVLLIAPLSWVMWAFVIPMPWKMLNKYIQSQKEKLHNKRINADQ